MTDEGIAGGSISRGGIAIRDFNITSALLAETPPGELPAQVRGWLELARREFPAEVPGNTPAHRDGHKIRIAYETAASLLTYLSRRDPPYANTGGNGLEA